VRYYRSGRQQWRHQRARESDIPVRFHAFPLKSYVNCPEPTAGQIPSHSKSSDRGEKPEEMGGYETASA
jgi:hypothetical protein